LSLILSLGLLSEVSISLLLDIVDELFVAVNDSLLLVVLGLDDSLSSLNLLLGVSGLLLGLLSSSSSLILDISVSLNLLGGLI